MPNRLIDETSPYLLQHANNPVDWYPWGEEALARSRDEDKPIMLSIGYSACHWCHVMEHESFEDEETAQLMNSNFVSIKVDREERPDLDGIYMAAVQAMTGQGGWPMTVFLTPEGKPFFAGTYFPKDERYGMPSFKRVLQSVVRAYTEQRSDIEQQSTELVNYLGDRMGLAPEPGALTATTLDNAVGQMMRDFEPRYGGFGNAPKFPQAMDWEFLLLRYARQPDPQLRQMLDTTLRNMAEGGMYDQLAGGFHRYSVDTKWLVPHFEKMLYDNALLARLYLHAYQVTGEAFYRRVVEEILEYVAREMTSPEGGFYSTQDADSEGEEGKFYVWSEDEVDRLLGPDRAPAFKAFYDVTKAGNFEGHNIINVRDTAEGVAQKLGLSVEQVLQTLATGRRTLFEAREPRIHPGRDEKVLVSWNGLMMRAFAEAARVLDNDEYRQIAVNNAHFLLDKMHEAGGLFRTYKDGRPRLNAYLEDYSFYAAALLELYETTFELRWYEAGRALIERMIDDFADAEQGGFYDTAIGHEQLITRPKDMIESAIPSGNSVAAEVLLQLYRYSMEDRYYQHAQRTLEAAGPLLDRYPRGMGHMLLALDSFVNGGNEIAVIGDPTDEATRTLLDVLYNRFAPHDVIAAATPGDGAAIASITLLQDRPQRDDQPTVYVCRNYACQMPVTSVEDLKGQLGDA